MNCDNGRCTQRYYMSFYRAFEVHGMYIHLDLYRGFISRCARHVLLFRLPCIRRQHARHLLSCSRVISTVMHGIYIEFRSSVHLLTCTARTVKSANRASSVHSSICTAYTVISLFRASFSRRGVRYLRRHLPLYCVDYIVYVNYIVFLGGGNYAEHPSAADVHLIIVLFPT